MIVKLTPDPADDRYVVWSTGTDGPVFVGDAAEVAGYLVAAAARQAAENARRSIPDQLARAAKTGTSARSGDFGFDDDPVMTLWSADGNSPLDRPHEIARADLAAWLTSGDNARYLTPEPED